MGDGSMNRRMISVVMYLWLALVLPVGSGAGREVSKRSLMSHVRFLASESLQGRRAGQPGDRVAEAYVQAVFEQLGLEPLPALGDYRQEFAALESTLERDSTFLAVTDYKEEIVFRLDRDIFYILNRHSDLQAVAPVAFVGFGITAPEYGYDDYAGFNAEGKIVIVLDKEPGAGSDGDAFRGRAPTRHSFAASKEKTARQNGAAAVIVVSGAAGDHPDFDVTLQKRYRRELEQPYFGVENGEKRIPLIYATHALVEMVRQKTGIDLVLLAKKIDANLQPISTDLSGLWATLNIKLARVEEKKAANIIGYLEGSDEALRDEFIVIGAHHDHLGSLADGTVYCGADDNASGTAGLLESARWLAMESGELGRSVLFVSFCAEELGLIGSKYFIEHPPVPLDQIRLLINMDMIGRNNMDKEENEAMFITFPSAQTPLLAQILRTEAKALNVDVRVAPYLHFHGASDHVVFHDRGIPVIHYFSGFHSDYSSPYDTVDKIISAKMALVVRHLCRVAAAVCRVETMSLEYDESITEEPEKDPFDNPYSRRR
jgi:hypothetical protein